MPLALRIAIMTGIALLLGGATWLMLARGPALLIDLAAAVKALCL